MSAVKRIALVVGDFHTKEVATMIAAARQKAAEYPLEIVAEVHVPGSLEKPLAIKKLFQRSDIDGVVVLGIIERGETKHGLVMGQAVTQALIGLQLEFEKPMGLGILGPEILPDQIAPRLVPYAEAAVRALNSMLS